MRASPLKAAEPTSRRAVNAAGRGRYAPLWQPERGVLGALHTHATDLDGGFTAWTTAGLPVIALPAASAPVKYTESRRLVS